MPAYKDEKTGKWFAKFYYTNWQGIKKQKWKRGFATKKEALGFERDFLEKQSANPDMTFQNLYEIYMEDMAARLKQSTLLTKKTVLQTHILPSTVLPARPGHAGCLRSGSLLSLPENPHPLHPHKRPAEHPDSQTGRMRSSLP